MFVLRGIFFRVEVPFKKRSRETLCGRDICRGTCVALVLEAFSPPNDGRVCHRHRTDPYRSSAPKTKRAEVQSRMDLVVGHSIRPPSVLSGGCGSLPPLSFYNRRWWTVASSGGEYKPISRSDVSGDRRAVMKRRDRPWPNCGGGVGQLTERRRVCQAPCLPCRHRVITAT